MGNIIVSNSFVSVGNTEITAVADEAGYPKINVMDLWHLKRRFRVGEAFASTALAARYAIKFDFGAAQTVVGVFLNDVNFDKVRIYGNAIDLGTDWQTATYDSGIKSVSLDERVNRYKIYIPVTFNLQYMAINIPVTASGVGAYTTNVQIGTIAILSAATTFTKNMAYGYERSASKSYAEISLGTENVERVALSDNLQWFGTLMFDTARTTTQEADLWTFNRMDNAGPLFFYENDSDTSKAYICVRDSDYSGSIIADDVSVGTSIKLKELV